MMKRRRAFAVAMAVAMLVFMILSSAYIAREAGHGHDCVGEGCPICQFIAGIERLRGSLGGADLSSGPRYHGLQLFAHYVKENCASNFQQTWSQWLAARQNSY